MLFLLLLLLLGDLGGLFSNLPCTLKMGASRENFSQNGCIQRNFFFKMGASRENFSSKWVHSQKNFCCKIDASRQNFTAKWVLQIPFFFRI